VKARAIAWVIRALCPLLQRKDNDLRQLVDTDRGLVSRRIFIEPEIYRQELEQISARCWLFLCHDSQIPAPR
jgi:hypothetical protein